MSEALMDCSTMRAQTPAKQAAILLGEFEEGLRCELYSFLQRRGYEVIGVDPLEETEKCITARGSENVAAIVCDINWHPISEELTGYEFFQRCKAEHPDLPFILISMEHKGWDLPAVRSGLCAFWHSLSTPMNCWPLCHQYFKSDRNRFVQEQERLN